MAVAEPFQRHCFASSAETATLELAATGGCASAGSAVGAATADRVAGARQVTVAAIQVRVNKRRISPSLAMWVVTTPRIRQVMAAPRDPHGVRVSTAQTSSRLHETSCPGGRRHFQLDAIRVSQGAARSHVSATCPTGWRAEDVGDPPP